MSWLKGAITGITDIVTGGALSDAKDASKNSVAAWSSTNPPTADELTPEELDYLVKEGKLEWEDAEAILRGGTAYDDIAVDPKLKEAQMRALKKLGEVAENDGLTVNDRAQMEAIKTETAAQERGQRESILQNMAERGMGGSGFELMANLKNQQDSATRASQEGFNVAAQAQNRAMQAILESGKLSGSMRDQEFGEQEKIAAARDALDAFNTNTANQFTQFNKKGQTDADKFNLGRDDEYKFKNKDIEAKNKWAPVQGRKDAWGATTDKASGLSGAYSGAAGTSSNAGSTNANIFGSVLGAGASLYTGGKEDKKSDERAKTDIEHFDVDDFLDDLTGYKYKYKRSEDGEGTHTGVMAQDLEKTKEGKKLVYEDEEGMKRVKYDESLPLILASLAELHKKIK